MAKSFLSTASKKVTDVRGFLREAAGGTSIKYVAEKGAKHLLYIPYVNVPEEDEHGTAIVKKQVIAISGEVHEWHSPDGKYKASVCMKDVIRQDEATEILMNDGSCSICDRVSDAWDIYRYRRELEEAACKLSGEDRKKHLEKAFGTYADERKAKDARSYMYILVVKYRSDGTNIVIGPDKLPEYDLKVMKLSNSRVEKIQQQIANAGADLPGSEIMFEYPATDDRRLQVSQSTTAPVFPNNMLTVRYPALLEKLTQDVGKFEWEGIEKSFPEWNGMSAIEAKNITDALFEKWDQYRQEVLINPSVKYMEYITNTPVTNPALNVTPSFSGPTAALPGFPGIGAAIGGEAPVIPGAPNIPDVNAVFGGATEAPTIKI